MQEAGRGRQRGQQLPGLRAGASSWPQPQTPSDPGSSSPRSGRPPHRPASLTSAPGLTASGLRAPPGGHSRNSTFPPTRRLPDPVKTQPPSLHPCRPRMAVPGATLPPLPQPQHSPGHKKAVDSAGSGSAQCQPRKSSWCRCPLPSAPRQPPDGPGGHTTGWELKGQETRWVGTSPIHAPGLSSPSPSFWPLTLALLTAAARLGHFQPAMGAGKGLALLEVTFHMTPL